MPEERVEEEEVIVTVADGRNREKLVTYRFPLHNLVPFHPYHFELIQVGDSFLLVAKRARDGEESCSSEAAHLHTRRTLHAALFLALNVKRELWIPIFSSRSFDPAGNRTKFSN